MKQNSRKVLYVLHRGAIHRESFRTKKYKPKTRIYLCIKLIGMIKKTEIRKYVNLTSKTLQCFDIETV